MKMDTHKWGDSTVSIKYVYDIVYSFLDAELTKEQMQQEISRFMDELAYNYKIDTGKRIEEEENA